MYREANAQDCINSKALESDKRNDLMKVILSLFSLIKELTVAALHRFRNCLAMLSESLPENCVGITFIAVITMFIGFTVDSLCTLFPDSSIMGGGLWGNGSR